MTRSSLLSLLAAAAALGVGGVGAAPPPAKQTANPRILAAEILADVKYLASPELEGRRPGSPGNDLAADYIARRFRAAGVKPAGEAGTYFQRFSVINGVGLGPYNALRLGTRKLTVREDFMPLAFTKNGSAAGSVVFAGYGISAPELKFDEYAGLDVKQKIAIVLRYTPDGDPNGRFAEYSRLASKIQTARDRGAAGVLFVTGPATESPESLGDFSLESNIQDSGIPVAFVKRAAVDELLAPAGKNLRDLQTALAHGQPASFPVPGADAALTLEVRRKMAPTRNVIGRVEGSDPRLKGEYVVIGAHYDHLGYGGNHSLSDSRKPEIHHGADDNASGTAALLEIGHYLAANRAKLGRSVLLMGFTAEESGLLGSMQWVNRPTVPLKNVVAMLNLDMVGRMRNETVQIVGAGTSPAWSGILEAANRPVKLQAKAGGGSAFGGSDHQSFLNKRIPVLFFFTGTHPDYHRPSDTWDKVNPDGTARIAQMTAEAAIAVSRLAQRPEFVASKDPAPTPGPGFRVYLGTIPEYSYEGVGVLLSGVRAGSPAEKAGIQADDVLVEFGGKSVRNVEEYTGVLATARPGVPVKVVVMRKGTRVELTLTPVARN
jgi:aminopeptidase YwaD